MRKAFVMRWMPRRGACVSAACSVIVLTTGSTGGLEIQGVQNASLDQPRINVALTLPGSNDPLTATGEDIFGTPFETFNIQAFYDTGASGVLISSDTADALGVPIDPGVVFSDVGVGGTEDFAVSTALDVHLAPFDLFGEIDIDNPASFASVYNHSFTNIRAQVGPIDAPTNPLLSGLDVFGMPVFAGKTVVMDNRSVNQVAGTIRTDVYDSVPNNPNVPITQRHVQLSYGDFARFTETTPSPDKAPTLADNPFIGPNPVLALDGVEDDTPGVTIRHDGKSHTGSWLYDTGAAASILSESIAATLGVTYAPDDGDPLTGPVLVGVPLDRQFTLTIGGIGGSSQVAGFFLDSLTVPTIEGDGDDPDDPLHIHFDGAPVLVADITLQDPDTGDMLTLDGVFGMNFQVGSIFVSEPLQLGDIRAGAFDFITFDQPSGVLGLRLNPDVVEDGDMDVDGRVTARDVSLFRVALDADDEADYAEAAPLGVFAAADFDGDGDVDADDLAAFLGLVDAETAALTSGDFDGDGDVDAFDLGRWQSGFGRADDATVFDGDADRDRDVDAFDLGRWQSNFGASGGATVPEPGAITAVLLLNALLCRRKPRGSATARGS